MKSLQPQLIRSRDHGGGNNGKGESGVQSKSLATVSACVRACIAPEVTEAEIRQVC